MMQRELDLDRPEACNATILTGWWFGHYTSTHIKIGISRGVPRGQPAGYRIFRKLAPGTWFNSVSVEEYRSRYLAQLNELDAGKVVEEIMALAGDRVPVLVCYESPVKPGDFCHRGFVSAWLEEQLGLAVPELGFEKEGHGWAHPKLPRVFRRLPPPPLEPLDVAPFIGAESADPQGVVWTVVGQDPENIDQALIRSGDAKMSISGNVLHRRFTAAE
jgi:hypothetical protein